MNSVDRRRFLRRTVGGVIVPGSLAGLVAACTERDPSGALLEPRATRLGNAGQGNGGHGPLDNDQGVLVLPKRLQVRMLSAIGDPMSDGNVTPIAFDGMAAFAAGSPIASG